MAGEAILEDLETLLDFNEPDGAKRYFQGKIYYTIKNALKRCEEDNDEIFRLIRKYYIQGNDVGKRLEAELDDRVEEWKKLNRSNFGLQSRILPPNEQIAMDPLPARAYNVPRLVPLGQFTNAEAQDVCVAIVGRIVE